jgi:hypothetical protein
MAKLINLTRNKEYYYLLGVLLGDGSIAINRIRIAVKDKEFIMKCKQSLECCLNLEKKLKIKKRKNWGFKNYSPSYLYHIDFCSVLFSSLVKEDIENLEKLKDKEKMISFLEGIYDSEGSVGKDRMRIRLIMRDFSIRTINLISIFLNALKISHKIRKNFYKEQQNNFFIIDINGSETIKFYKLIKFSIPYKQKRLELHNKNNEKNWISKAKMKEEAMRLSEKEWCQKYNLSRSRYFVYKRNFKILVSPNLSQKFIISP